MQLFSDKASNHCWNAQQNLMGRTHYVDPDTLKFHKSRVLSSGTTDGGLAFWIIESAARDYDGTLRGFRYVVFDVFGHVLSRVELKDMWSSKEAARKAMWKFLNAFDAVTHTRQAIGEARVHYEKELAYLAGDVDAIAERIGHHKAPEVVS